MVVRPAGEPVRRNGSDQSIGSVQLIVQKWGRTIGRVAVGRLELIDLVLTLRLDDLFVKSKASEDRLSKF